MRPSDRTAYHATFAALSLAGLIPILAVKYVPSSDLPNHILIAATHAGVLASGDGGLLTAQWLPSPYVLFYLMMYPLIILFGTMAASKILLGLYAVMLPYSVLLLATQFNFKHRFLAFLSFPFIYTYHFDYGFIPYCIGIPFVFIGLSVLDRGLSKGLPAGHVAALGALTLATYLSHFLNLGVFAIGAILILWMRRREIPGIRQGSAQPYLSLSMKLVAALVPTAICALYYVFYLISTPSHLGSAFGLVEWAPVFRQLTGGVRVLFSIDGWVDYLELTALIVILLWLLSGRSARIRKGFLMYFGLVMMFLAFAVPRERLFGGAEFSTRFAIYGMIPLLMSFEIKRIFAGKLLIAVMAALVLLGTTVRTARYTELSSLTSAYLQAVSSTVPPGSRICTIYNAFPESRIPLLLHDIAYYHLDNGGYSPFLFTDQVHVAGVGSKTELPRLSESWNPDDTLGFNSVFSHYDYIVIATAGSVLPEPFSAMAHGIVYHDSVCTIIEVERLPTDLSPPSDK